MYAPGFYLPGGLLTPIRLAQPDRLQHCGELRLGRPLFVGSLASRHRPVMRRLQLIHHRCLAFRGYLINASPPPSSPVCDQFEVPTPLKRRACAPASIPKWALTTNLSRVVPRPLLRCCASAAVSGPPRRRQLRITPNPGCACAVEYRCSMVLSSENNIIPQSSL